MPPVADEVRQECEEHPRGRPEQLQCCAGEGAMNCWEQFASHYYTDQTSALHTYTEQTYTPYLYQYESIVYNTSSNSIEVR